MFGYEGSTVEFFGRYLEVTPHSRLVWTNDEGDGGGTVTTVTFQETGGQTLLLVHDLYPSKEALDGAIASGSICRGPCMTAPAALRTPCSSDKGSTKGSRHVRSGEGHNIWCAIRSRTTRYCGWSGTAYRIRTGDLRLERAVSWASRRMRPRRRRASRAGPVGMIPAPSRDGPPRQSIDMRFRHANAGL